MRMQHFKTGNEGQRISKGKDLGRRRAPSGRTVAMVETGHRRGKRLSRTQFNILKVEGGGVAARKSNNRLRSLPHLLSPALVVELVGSNAKDVIRTKVL